MIWSLLVAIVNQIDESYAIVDGDGTLTNPLYRELDVRELAHMTNTIIGRTFKEHRRQARMSETEFANRLNRKRGFVRLVEAGRHPLTLTEFKAFAEVLGISHLELADDLFKRIDASSHPFSKLW
jgi:ribosome-binding protein aMBF1 (putative translation factor)